MFFEAIQMFNLPKNLPSQNADRSFVIQFENVAIGQWCSKPGNTPSTNQRDSPSQMGCGPHHAGKDVTANSK
jgi:hypothetical protein